MNRILFGDCRETLPELAAQGVRVQCVVTSPPYWGLRSYLPKDHPLKPLEIGSEPRLDCLGWATGSPCGECFICHLVAVFRAVRGVLADDGVCWINMGDSYANDAKWGGSSSGKHVKALHGNTGIGRGKRDTGLKAKDLCAQPWRLGLALQADGWYLRQDIIWHKPNPMPESVTDRCTKAHEYLFLLSKSERYYFDSASLREPVSEATLADGRQERGTRGTKGEYAAVDGNCGFSADGLRNKRSVWTINTQPYSGAHFATFPPALIEPCILAGSRVGDVVLDPFMGSGTTAQVAQRLGRSWIGCEINEANQKLQAERTTQFGLMLA